MSARIIISLFLLIHVHFTNGQVNHIAYPELNMLYQFEWILEAGNKRNLRDVAGYLDDENLGQKALKILQSNTLFSKTLIDLTGNPGKQAFYDFYYSHEKEIKYSHFLEAFYIGQIEDLKMDFEATYLEAINPSAELDKFCLEINSQEDSKSNSKILKEIVRLQSEFGIPFNDIYNCIERSKKLLLSAIDNPELIKYAFPDESLIKNEQLDQKSFLFKKIYGFTEDNYTLVDLKRIKNSLGPTNARIKKYEDIFQTKEIFYYSEVDFYGTLLCKLPSENNRESLISSLLNTRDSKALYYLAAFNMKLRRTSTNADILSLIQNLSHQKIVSKNNDDLNKSTYLFWLKNYSNYEWDSKLKRFTSQVEKEETTKNLEKLIRRLNSKNDSVAVASYIELSKAEPESLNKLLTKYSKIMTKINRSVPSLKYNYLQTLSRLVEYCESNKFNIEIDSELNSLLIELSGEREESKRFKIENKVLNNITLNNVSSLEYWAILNSNSKLNSFSVGRILDIFYSRNWDNILQDPTLFKKYIFTAILFRNLDGAGSCKNYHKKFNPDDQRFIYLVDWLNKNANSEYILEGFAELLSLIKKDRIARVSAKMNDGKNLLQQIQLEETIGYKEFNKLLDVPNILIDKREEVLALISKISPKKEIRKLAIKGAFNKDDLKYFEGIEYEYKDLASIIRFFNQDNPREVITFLLGKTKEFTLDQKAYVANSFFRNSWFLNYLDSTNSISTQCQDIMILLTDYLMQSEYISEMEDRKTQLNIVLISMIGMDLSNKLRLSMEMEIDQSARSDLQKNIIAKLDFEHLGELLYYVDGLIDQNGNNDISFLNKDFGLPIFEFNSLKEINIMRERTKTLSQKEFYINYLEEFGVDFLDKKGNLDFYKIGEILSYDLAYRFVGKGGGHRDYFVYGIIKVLELHFDDYLGFNQKLNEYQTFYKYTSSTRANAWMEYLVKNGYLESDKLVPSF